MLLEASSLAHTHETPTVLIMQVNLLSWLSSCKHIIHALQSPEHSLITEDWPCITDSNSVQNL